MLPEMIEISLHGKSTVIREITTGHHLFDVWEEVISREAIGE
jgi:hypothetical protein